MSKRSIILIMAACLALAACEDKAPVVPPAPAAPSMPTALVATPDFCGNNAYVHCANICDIGPRPSGSEGYAKQLDYLEKHLHAAGWKTAKDSFRLSNGISMNNLRATFGNGEHTRPLLISCHIDTKVGISDDFVGADDGASGAATMLELARVLAKDTAKAEKIEFIFLDGEESFAPRMTETDGLYGSKYDVARRKGELPTWQINLDMVGGRNKIIAIPGLQTSDFMYAHYSQAVRNLGLSAERWTVLPGNIMDDHLPYLRAGVDSINLIAYFSDSNWWHTTRDNMSRICPKSLQESGNMTLQLIKQLFAAM